MMCPAQGCSPWLARSVPEAAHLLAGQSIPGQPPHPWRATTSRSTWTTQSPAGRASWCPMSPAGREPDFPSVQSWVQLWASSPSSHLSISPSQPDPSAWGQPLQPSLGICTPSFTARGSGPGDPEPQPSPCPPSWFWALGREGLRSGGVSRVEWVVGAPEEKRADLQSGAWRYSPPPWI